jgi:trigger factor
MNNITIKEIKSQGLLRAYEVSISGKHIESVFDEVLKEKAATTSIPGFRPGKVNPEVVRQRRGKEILNEVLENLVDKSSQEVVLQYKLTPSTQPHFHPAEAYEKGKDFKYTLHVEVLPEIESLDFASVTIPFYKIKMDSKKLDFFNQLRANASGETVAISEKRKTQMGDFVLIDFKGFVGGTPLKGGESQDFELELGGGQFIPGFEEGLVGFSVGDRPRIKVKFPEAYQEKSIAGKPAEFDVFVKEIREKVPSEINDALAEKHGYKSVAEMTKANEAYLLDMHAKMSKDQAKQDILDKLAEIYDFMLPRSMVNLEFRNICYQLENEVEPSKRKEYREQNLASWEKEYFPIAGRRVLLGLVLAKLAKEYKLAVQDKEVHAAIMQEAQESPGQEAQIFKHYRDYPQAAEHLRANILESKVIDFIQKNVKLIEKEVSEEDLTKIQKDRMDLLESSQRTYKVEVEEGLCRMH